MPLLRRSKLRIIPHLSEDLISDLEEHYPPRCIDPMETLEDAHRYAGMVELIQTLRARLEYTKESAALEELLRT